MADTSPALTGSDKQITWATDIRARVIAALDEFRAGMAAHVAEHPEAAPEQAANNAALDAALAAHVDARWWIEEHKAGTGDTAATAEQIAYLLRREAAALLAKETTR